jgi:hypothetical protein
MADGEIVNHDLAPRPKHKAVPFDKVHDFQQAMDYALQAFHVCVDKVEKGGADKERWNQSGWAYFTAYTSMVALREVPGDHLGQCKGILAEADHKADVAAGRA